MSVAIAFPPGVLPWTDLPQDRQRFRRILKRTLTTSLIAALILAWLPVSEPDRSKPAELPPPLVKLLLERPPMVAKVERLPAPVESKKDSKADAPKLEVSKAEPAKVPVPEARRPQPNKPPGEIDGARRKASGVGLLAMANELAEIRGAPVAVQLKSDIKPGPGVGTGQGPGVGAGFEHGTPARAIITSNATRGSGGINVAAYSRDTGGGGLAGRATTLVEGVAGGGGGGGAGGGGAVAGGGRGGSGKGAGGTVQRSGSGKASRSIEEIRLVFERNKGAIYAIYNRALREDPTLQGKVVLELKIAPSGAVTDLRLVSSELRAVELEGKLLARVRQFDFGAKDVELMTVTWPVDFLPS